MYKKTTMLLVVGALLSGCNDKAQEPDKSLPEKEVLPNAVKRVLENDCGSCHGIDQSNFEAYLADGRESYFYFPVNEAGKITNEERTKEIALSHGRVDFGEKARFSDLLRVPLVKDFGGMAHKGLDIYFTTKDKSYRILEKWVQSEIDKSPKSHKEMPENLAYFEEKVIPVMQRNGCFMSSCHGETSFTDLKLSAPLPTGEMSREILESNHKAMLGKVTRFVNLGGDLNKSRIIAKNLPITEGGIHQRGGNNTFFSDLNDPDVEILREWQRKEQVAFVNKWKTDEGKLTVEDLNGELRGIVFIRGIKEQPRKFFDFSAFYGGSNIFLVDPKTGEEKQLTSYENAEVQALDVSYDARKVVFSMRKNKDDGFRIYELDLKSLEITQQSFGANNLEDGTIVHHIDPSYKTGHKEDFNLSDVEISYASNEAGMYVQSEQWAIVGEADNNSSNSVVIDLQRHEKAGTYTGKKIHFTRGKNQGETRVIAKHEKNKLILDKPLEHKMDVTSIYVIDTNTPNYLPSFDIYTFAPGDYETSKNRITWSNAQERKPTMRTSGALMTTTVRNMAYQDGKPVFNGAIFRLEAGGWDHHPHGGERSGMPLYTDSRETAGGLELRLAHDPRNLWSGGTMVLADHGLGVITEPNNPTDALPLTDKMDEVKFSALPRYISEQVIVDKTANYTGVSENGAYRDPYPLPDGHILVAATNELVDHLDPNSAPDWDLYKVQFDVSAHAVDGHNAGTFKKIKLAGSKEGMSEYNPRPVVVRLQENRHHAIKGQKFIPKVKTEIVHGVQRAPEDTPSHIEIYDVPLLFSFLPNFNQAEKRVIAEDGEIAYVRILEIVGTTKDELKKVESDDAFSTPHSLGVHSKKLIVAEAPVEADNSAYIQLPNNAAWVYQALNKDKQSLFTLQREFFSQPGEKFTQSIPRSKFSSMCAGCHGSLSGDPATSFGEPDLNTASSEVMATFNKDTSVRRNPFNHGITRSEYIDIDFVRDVQPILDKHCVSCHDSGSFNLKGDKTKNYSIAYETLHQLTDPTTGNFADKKYINERESMSSDSYLIELLQSGDKEHSQLSKEELLTLSRWIDMGANFEGVFQNESK